MRRWKAGSRYDFDGITVAIYPGAKGNGDLVLKAFVNGRWVPLRMEFSFFLAEFFSENEEEAIFPQRPHWRKHGDTYFLGQLQDAVKNGWEGPAQRIRDQRSRLRDSAADGRAR